MRFPTFGLLLYTPLKFKQQPKNSMGPREKPGKFQTFSPFPRLVTLNPSALDSPGKGFTGTPLGPGLMI